MQHITRQQEKAMFDKKNRGQTRSDTKPTILGRFKFNVGRIKSKKADISEKLRERKERKGRERIEKEIESGRQEQAQLKRLKVELEVEQARETLAKQRAETQAGFKEIEKARRARKFAPFISAGKRAVATGKIAVATAKTLEKATRPKKTRKKKAEDTGFFGI